MTAEAIKRGGKEDKRCKFSGLRGKDELGIIEN